MYKFTGPAARAALVAGLVSALGSGYAAHAAGHPVTASPHGTCAQQSGAGEGTEYGSRSGPGTSARHGAKDRGRHPVAAMGGEEEQPPPGYGGFTEESGYGQEKPCSPAPTGTPPEQSPTPVPSPTWPSGPTPTGTPTWPAPTPPASTPPTRPPTSPPATWTPAPTPTYPDTTPSETPAPPETAPPGTPETSPSPSSPPRLAETGADSNASLLGALSVGAVVTGAAALALSRRASRGKYGK
ncbi:hypothetical protein DT019_28600 [Streptomyces sp. SDr-06]|uniref:hypothetical protein n=1 Tax=Streptomyces sp. SDr-06 TaxID=2267702 RepID=UPI000DE91EA3|nr:hypothetical protein [Streptomyces sp. SDr-06]RCH65426.1 hypothetical protein DT019_28600 [Streptomyces sp. SDr-06]